ncbi:GPI alpha-1,4-mannosyltransferase I, catalytic subunit-like [Glandiceps talaboti]
MWSFENSLCIALVTRFALVLYGEWQDRAMLVPYTDVDYHVFTDAARYITQGESPYERATYRYTPLLAWLLIPNIYILPIFGKMIFVLCDVASGYLIYKLLRLRQCPEYISHISSLFWLFNPLPMAVSSRGNAESIMALLVLLCLQALMTRKTKTAAFLLGLAVHMKIYPITYSLPMYMLLDSDYKCKTIKNKAGTKNLNPRLDDSHGVLVKTLWYNKSRIEFVVVASITFVVLTALTYHCYGFKAIEETYLYHITRKDIRHNFSVYFYMLYLNAEWEYAWILGLAVFVPQLVLLILTSFKYRQDIAFCCFVHTFLFVTFNKVCTSQYFLWYLCLLPLVLPTLRMRIRSGIFLIGLWGLGQAIWLNAAYLLEFEGQNTFLYVWLAGIVFFAINILILVRLFRCHLMFPLFRNEKITSLGF